MLFRCQRDPGRWAACIDTTGALPATTGTYELAEGPLWDADRRRLLWVDILDGAVLAGTLDAGTVVETARHRFDEMVGAVVVGADGTLLVAAQEHLVVVVASDGTHRDGPRIVEPEQGRRLNDGATDPAGRFLIGTLALDGPSERETLVRVEPDGSVTVLDDDLSLSNGLAWSADGRLLYSVDTLRHVVNVRSYDPLTGAVGRRSVHLRVEDGSPDGITLDSAGHL